MVKKISSFISNKLGLKKLSEKGIAIASAVVTGVTYLICFAIVIIFGSSSLKFFNLFVHGIDLTSIAASPDIISGIIGFVISVVAAYAIGWLFAVIYNKYS